MIKKEIIVIEDDKVLNKLIVEQLSNIGYLASGVHSWKEAKKYLEEHEPGLALLDCHLPDVDGHQVIPELATHQPVIVLTAYGTVQNAVAAIKDGATEYLIKPINLDELELTVKKVLETAELRADNLYYKERMQAQNRRMIGSSPAMEKVNDLINAVAPSDMTVLIEGESGVGKELVAQELHQRSLRSDKKFVELDCCTLQENLFESELFGHERGAFTSADRMKRGLIEGADNGTLFLDEIGEIDSVIQAKLLRVLETGKFRRLGGTKDLTANTRIVTATNRKLDDMTNEGNFRTDLFYRLSSFIIHVPPLRERREDIPDLVQYFILNHDFSHRVKKKISQTTMKHLISYDWPGNIRELKNVVERAIILSRDSNEILAEHFAFLPSQSVMSLEVSMTFDHDPTLEEIERKCLENMLSKYSGHRAKVATILGVSERNLYRLLQKHELH
jgi:DNA-binding NtrC family response regulator